MKNSHLHWRRLTVAILLVCLPVGASAAKHHDGGIEIKNALFK